MQIFHKNNAKTVRAQTVVRAYERAMSNHNELGSVLWVRTMGVAAPRRPEANGVVNVEAARIKTVKVGRGKNARMVRRVNVK